MAIVFLCALIKQKATTLFFATTNQFLLFGREFAEVGRCALGEPVSASPAFADGRIYLRGESQLYCIGS